MKKKLLLLLHLITTFFASAQNVGIGTSIPIARLHVADSNVLFTGPATVSASTSYYPPAQGAGTRMMWYPEKAAFRVGGTNGDTWDYSKIGRYSIATGFATNASGDYSTAMGAGSVATGLTSLAIGAGNLSSGTYSTAIGYQSAASGNNATAIGIGTVASGNGSTALGVGSVATGLTSISIGAGNHSAGNYSTAIGYQSAASGLISTSMGSETVAAGQYSTSMGRNTVALGDYSTVMGANTVASGVVSIAMGVNTTANSFGEVTIGAFNTNYTAASADTWNASDRLFVIGNGTAGANRDAMVVLKNGNMGVGTSAPHALLQLGNSITNRKIVLYDVNNNDHQYFGVGINGGMLRYQIDDVASQYGFYAGTGAGSSNWVFAMHGNGNAFCSGTFTELSDARLKKNIEPLGASLDKLIQLNGYSYNWISEHKDPRQQIGLLAQEVQQLYPQLVTEIKGDNNESNLGINYIGLIPVLIESIKTLQKEVEELKKKIQ
jgi:hypothetical protein